MTHRSESDTMGEIDVDNSVYWGAQTQRSLQNFKIGHDKMPRSIIRALGIIKQASADVNLELGKLDKELNQLIVSASQEVIEG